MVLVQCKHLSVNDSSRIFKMASRAAGLRQLTKYGPCHHAPGQGSFAVLPGAWAPLEMTSGRAKPA